MSRAISPIEHFLPLHPPKEILSTIYDLPFEDPESAGLLNEYRLWHSQLCSAT
ncbi:hypothetical protein [Scytonema sp. PRP1]|uniref:hypothetical protein n=1 Tax=Scytonema sp. PRP1 TaxID=3120513 RepID=UPI00300C2E25